MMTLGPEAGPQVFRPCADSAMREGALNGEFHRGEITQVFPRFDLPFKT